MVDDARALIQRQNVMDMTSEEINFVYHDLRETNLEILILITFFPLLKLPLLYQIPLSSNFVHFSPSLFLYVCYLFEKSVWVTSGITFKYN